MFSGTISTTSSRITWRHSCSGSKPAANQSSLGSRAVTGVAQELTSPRLSKTIPWRDIAFTRVGRVDRDSELNRRPPGTRDTVDVGDVLGAVPIGTREEFSVWPEVAVQRPHTREWETLMRELADITDWVRQQALPIVIAGDSNLPPIPPSLDITLTHESADAGWRAAGRTAAPKRMQNRIGGEQLRTSVLDMLVSQFGQGSQPAFSRWLDRMDDEQVMTTFWD